jgi:UDP-galactose transporter
LKGFFYNMLPETTSKAKLADDDESRTVAINDTYHLITRISSCVALLFFSVSATILTQLSKTKEGKFGYNTFVIPLSVEVIKLTASALSLYYTNQVHGSSTKFSLLSFVSYAIPAFCYFVSNNCMFYIIHELGPATFQVTNNLKTLSTALLMRLVLSRRMTWLQVKALVILFCGSVVTQLKVASDAEKQQDGTKVLGYILVFVNAFAAGVGGVYSEKLLKGNKDDREMTSIHFQNCQLYFFGICFGFISLVTGRTTGLSNVFEGFNVAAYATIAVLAACGLLVSFILKYLDNIAKCFVGALSMIAVGLLEVSVSSHSVPLQLSMGIVLTTIAVEQFNLPQTNIKY